MRNILVIKKFVDQLYLDKIDTLKAWLSRSNRGSDTEMVIMKRDNF